MIIGINISAIRLKKDMYTNLVSQKKVILLRKVALSSGQGAWKWVDILNGNVYTRDQVQGTNTNYMNNIL